MKKKWLAIFVTISCGFVACSDDILDNTPENQYTIDDNNQMKLNIFKTINTGEISKMYIYIDSIEHYPFDTGVNATLSVEWIK